MFSDSSSSEHMSLSSDPKSFISAASPTPRLLSPHRSAMLSLSRLRPAKISAQLRQISTDFQICRTSTALCKRLPEWLALLTEIFPGRSTYTLSLSDCRIFHFVMTFIHYHNEAWDKGFFTETRTSKILYYESEPLQKGQRKWFKTNKKMICLPLMSVWKWLSYRQHK